MYSISSILDDQLQKGNNEILDYASTMLFNTFVTVSALSSMPLLMLLQGWLERPVLTNTEIVNTFYWSLMLIFQKIVAM
jgi:hypothetical protein